MILGKKLCKLLEDNSATISKCFNIENLAPDRKSPSTIICVSGYLSEKDVYVKEWEGIIENITDENIVGYLWPAKTITKLGEKLIGSIVPYIQDIKKKGISI